MLPYKFEGNVPYKKFRNKVDSDNVVITCWFSSWTLENIYNKNLIMINFNDTTNVAFS
jgi:hypothetical protein